MSAYKEMEPSKETDEHRHMRRVAFIAVVVSTVAVIASVVALPMVYQYVQRLQSHMMAEMDFCKVGIIVGNWQCV
jgi:hypothetical protein